MTSSVLFSSTHLGALELPNRMVMAPMTRGRAGAEGVPTPQMAEYYAARSDAGLLISEATAISPQGSGWCGAPTIVSEAQAKGWSMVTDAVHQRHGRFFLQLWHMGRVSHPSFLRGELPVAPSAIAARGETTTPEGTQPYVTPRALTKLEIRSTVDDYAAAAARAVRAGSDGVEIHAANGYLIDQFLRDCSNRRTDEYGGPVSHRLRFLIEVVEAVVGSIGAARVGVRLSPRNSYNDMSDSDPVSLFSAVARALRGRGLAYLHSLEALPGHMLAAAGERISPLMRREFDGAFIVNGGFDRTSAEQAISSGEADLVAFGVPFLANPDLVRRLREKLPLNAPDFSTFYTPGTKGYLDYPLHP